MVQQGTACPLSCVVSIIFNYQQKATSPVPTSTIAAPYESSSESSGLGMLDLCALVT